MTEGIVRIYLSYVEPEDKNLLWLRPRLNHEGFVLLYFGSNGWAPLCHKHNKCSHNNSMCEEEPLTSIVDSPKECDEEHLWEIEDDYKCSDSHLHNKEDNCECL